MDADEIPPKPEADPSAPKGVPEFWVTALAHVEELENLLEEKDMDALKSLTDIRIVGEEGKKVELCLIPYYRPSPEFLSGLQNRVPICSQCILHRHCSHQGIRVRR